MADYPKSDSTHIDTSFTHLHSGRDFLPEPIPGSHHSCQTQPQMRDVTWISNSQSQHPLLDTHTSQTSRYVPSEFQPARTPTPVLCESAPTIVESELEVEYMTITVDDHDQCNHGHGHDFSGVMTAATNGKSEKKNNFVGAFISSLRRLPKVMFKGWLRDYGKPERQGTNASTMETGRTTLPRFTGPPITGVADDISAVEQLETPPRGSSVSPHPRHASPGDGDGNIRDGRPERSMLSAICEHSSEHALHPSFHHPHAQSHSDDTPTSSCPPFEREGDLPNAMSTPIPADTSIRVPSPILVEPRPSADFMRMDSPIRPPPAESVRSQISRMSRFVQDLSRLPWIASSGTSIYVPGEATIRRYSRPISRNRTSWYTSHAEPIDLLAGPSTMELPPIEPPPSPVTSEHHQPVVPAPFILGSNANLLFAQSAQAGGGDPSSHESPTSTNSHGNQALALAPAHVAQPLFIYLSGLPQSGGPPEVQPLRPVYMLANSPP